MRYAGKFWIIATFYDCFDGVQFNTKFAARCRPSHSRDSIERELRTARLLEISRQSSFARFKARQWHHGYSAAAEYTDISAGVGFVGKSGNNSFVLGSGAGLGGDIKGARSSGITYNMKSRELILSKTLPCENLAPTYSALSQNLRVGEWLG